MFGLFGSDKPYKDAMHQYNKYAGQAQQALLPYQQAGQQAVGNYQNWLNGQQDPSQFINSLMQNYQQSPYNKFLQQQAANAGINSASASGMTGSTPFMMQQQQNAANIGQSGMQDWLSQVLGINTQYGQGQQNLMQGGQGAANAMSSLYQNQANNMGQMAYNAGRGKQNDLYNLLGHGLSMFL